MNNRAKTFDSHAKESVTENRAFVFRAKLTHSLPKTATA